MTSQTWSNRRGFMWRQDLGPRRTDYWLVKTDGYLEHLAELPEDALLAPDGIAPDVMGVIEEVVRKCREHVERQIERFYEEKEPRR